MSDYLKRAFRAQLTTTMDSLLRSAVFEIMTVFENSIHDHQMELAHKGEEVVQLKIKLQTAELKLRERECGGDRGFENNKTVTSETQKQPEPVQNTPEQTSDVPEIDVEVPDDWCAPLGCETGTKKDEVACPSTGTYHIDPHQQIKVIRKSKRGSSLNKKHGHTQDRSSPPSDQESRHPLVRSDNKFLQEIKRQYSSGLGLRRRRTAVEKEQENTVKAKRLERKAAETKSTKAETEKNDGEKIYNCKFCKKAFDTSFGRSVHIRSHKRCRGCKKEFPFPSALNYHKPSCEKLKKLLASEIVHANTPNSASSEEKTTSPSEIQASIKKEQSPSSSSHSKSSIQNDAMNKMHHCTHCDKRFRKRCKLKQHMSLHTCEKPFTCSVCLKKFPSNHALKHHMTRMHKGRMNPSEKNGDLAWTKPLEDIEDNQEDLISPSDNKKHTLTCNNVLKECSPRWQTMGLRNSDGFNCLLCQKFVKTKRQLTEHFRLHTGEKPFKCEKCLGRFRTCGQLFKHKKQSCCPVPSIQCDKCRKTFPSQEIYNKHVSLCQKKWPLICKVCGKGFIIQGRMRNHMERCHS
ncbi:zinc finger protein 345-like isoform X2 [Anabas testudineus]|uniref:C2H2-type domain-containing protein n=1 Tax=Anabas testudineus TaxID=64144 RepID=A0AAQ6IHA7_ANATE|nr:zinc finger protein 345-like isoform X2 [Anabas testudineus]